MGTRGLIEFTRFGFMAVYGLLGLKWLKVAGQAYRGCGGLSFTGGSACLIQSLTV